jgi:transposase InsO family protein
MNQNDKKAEVATFRFGVIADFVAGVRLNRGDKEKLLKEKISRRYEIPYSNKSRICRGTILKWIDFYKKGGRRIESLYPKTRSDKGKYKSIDASVRLGIIEIKKENPKLKVPALLKELMHRKYIGSDERISETGIYRFLSGEKLNNVNTEAVDKRRFEAQFPNEIWQSDVMHGPYVKVSGPKRKKVYLLAILDDHSRLIIHAQFYFSEGISDFRECLKSAIEKRGLPQKLYIDNGSCYRALHLEQIAAALGISIKHSRPYTPQGRGKIERWFKYVRDNFLAIPNSTNNIHLDELNEDFDEWVDAYNNKKHGTTKEKPVDRYQKNLECVRPAPINIIDYFRRVTVRKVKKDRTISLHGVIYEAPVVLIDKQVELKYHEGVPSEVEIFFNSMSFGNVMIVNPHVNAQIGRSWGTPSKKIIKKQKELNETQKKPQNGELFIGDTNEQL